MPRGGRSSSSSLQPPPPTEPGPGLLKNPRPESSDIAFFSAHSPAEIITCVLSDHLLTNLEIVKYYFLQGLSNQLELEEESEFAELRKALTNLLLFTEEYRNRL